jgi:hypothetical protein
MECDAVSLGVWLSLFEGTLILQNSDKQSLTVPYHRRLASPAVVLNIGLYTSMDVLVVYLTTLLSKSDVYFIN